MVFFKTGIGQKFFSRDVPEFISQLTRLNDNLERFIDRQEDSAPELRASESPESVSRVWIGIFSGKVLFVSSSPEDAQARKAAFEATGYTCTLSGPFGVNGT